MNSTKSVNVVIATIGIIASIYGYFTSENNTLFIATFISSTCLLAALFEENKDKKIKNN